MFSTKLNLYCKCSSSSIRHFARALLDNTKILMDYFGITENRARIFVNRNKLRNKDSDLLVDSIKYCKDLGYTDNEILSNPKLLTINPLILEQHYLTLEEGGFHTITPKVLSRGRYHMNKPIGTLKSMNLIYQETNVSDSFLKYITTPLPDYWNINKSTDEDIWNLVHLKIVQEFLKFKLEATDDEIIDLFRIHQMVKNKSLRIIQQNIAIAEELGFTPRKILKYGYLLHNYPKYTKTILNDFPNLAGADMRVAMRQYPKLVMTSPRNILKIYGILKNFGIPDETIRKRLNVLHMSPQTVCLRLEEIKRTPDLRVLLEHPQVLNLVVHHNRAKSRLSFLQQLQLKCASLIVLGSDDDIFDNHIREGKDINKLRDVLIFLKNLLQVDICKIEKRWKKHPFNCQVPFLEMEATFIYLREEKFTTRDILQVIHILLYPKEKIQKALFEIMANRSLPKNITKVQRLNLALYLIEKEHHFTGNGIWRKPEPEATDLPLKTLE